MGSLLHLVSALVLTSAGAWAVRMFNFSVLDSINIPSEGHERCQEIGYDGLAILSSPEAYRHALTVIAPNISSPKTRFSIGLFFKKAVRDFLWADGTKYADDTPWSNPPPDRSGDKTFGRIKGDGKLILSRNNFAAYSICGTYNSKESYGKALSGQQPDGQTSSLDIKHTKSFLQCSVLCGTDIRCRAAEFNFDLSICTTFSSKMYSGFTANNATSTFVREGF
ncbi:hypothetical protein RRG08_025806 [Elysia crispata]|uniref:Uncharacterized protein n=1 Tax=Elysia crispata TaxID=231223 RepID=A0AAE1CRQ6_9GAST|nr:hypothetical protein RRG08_025806 [Elysia crispata]